MASSGLRTAGKVVLVALGAAGLVAGGVFLGHRYWPTSYEQKCAAPDDRGAYAPQRKDELGDEAEEVVFLSQNWTPQESVDFYAMPHGSRLVPYSWFLALEQPAAPLPFNDPEHIRSLRFLPQKKTAFNPDGLPIGFVKDGGNDWLGLNCAACHTNQINYRKKGYRVDGGPSTGDLEGLFGALIVALNSTLTTPAKFDKFAEAVLKHKPADAEAADLKARVTDVIKTRVEYNVRNGHAVPANPHSPAPVAATHAAYGFARLDAFGGILNEVTAAQLGVPENARSSNAPVSYPCLWDTPQHDVVQWNGSVPNKEVIAGRVKIGALGRNAGEVLGVFGELTVPKDPSQRATGYPSSLRIPELIAAEDTLARLWSPEWPKAFGEPEAKQVALGKALYETHCVKCHVGIRRDDPNRKVVCLPTADRPFSTLRPIDEVKTDPLMAKNFLHQSATGLLKDTKKGFNPLDQQSWGANAAASDLLENAVFGAIIHGFYDQPVDIVKALARSAVARAAVAEVPKYKARPLNGVWATAPYLHNGSVPSLFQLLQPAVKRHEGDRARPAKFRVGRLEFDPKEVGFVYSEADAGNAFLFDTAVPGNSNAGHEYGTGLTDEERGQLVEYLKTL